MDFYGEVILNNSIQKWLIALSIFLFAFVGFALSKKLILKRIAKLAYETKNDFDDFLENQLSQTRLYFVFFLALYLASLVLILPQQISNMLHTLTIVVLILQAAFWVMGIIDYLIQRRIKKDHGREKVTATTMRAVNLVAKIALWSIVILLILENLTGIEVNTLIATLGVSSVAIALAVQNILGDLFSSVSIALDKPFVIGDAITVGEFSGTVEDIGLKSTRLRSVSGEQLIFSNSDLLKSRIQNYRSLERRQVAFILAVTYQTHPQKLAAIPEILREIIEPVDNVTFDRAYFKEFGVSALNFECVYFVEVPDFVVYKDLRHSINLAIFKRFHEEGIQFAYPTQTILFEGSDQAE